MSNSKLSNDDLADLFEELIFGLQILGENDFKISNYRKAVFAIKAAPFLISTASPTQIKQINGIGESILFQIINIIQNNQFLALNEVYSQIPDSVLELKKIRGLGPKKIHLLWLGLNIDSIEKLKIVINNGELEKVKGFGKKTVESFKESIAWIEANKGWFLYAQVAEMANTILNYCKLHFPQNKFNFVRQFALQREVINVLEITTDIDLSILKANTFFEKSEIENNKLSIKFEMADLPIIFYTFSENDYNKNTFLKSMSLTFKEKHFLNLNTFISEETAFAEINMPYVPIFERETDYYKNINPNLDNIITEKDIKGLIHCHSQYSDGENTLEEMALECIAKGLEYMVISDHSQSAFYANGLKYEQIRNQHAEIENINEKYPNFQIFKSIECDILLDGSLDYPDKILELFDILIISVHSNLQMEEKEATERICKALQNPRVNILGHSTGRLLLKREGYHYDIEKVFEICEKNKIAIELNANPNRLDIDWRYLPYMISKGIKTSINPDAHSLKGIDDLKYGVLAAQKGGVSKKDNLSSFTLEEFKKYFQL